MKLDVTIDSGSKNATVLTREVHVGTYKGEIEAMSYSDSSEAGVPTITTLIAKPEGLVPSQTTTVVIYSLPQAPSDSDSDSDSESDLGSFSQPRLE
jgi:hypothetical protein